MAPLASCRAYSPDDEDLVAAMMVSLYVEDPSPHVVDRAGACRTLRRLLAEPVRGRCVVLVGERPDVGAEERAGEGGGGSGPAGPAVGYALLCSFWSNELGGEICVVDEIYVAPPGRGQGLATRFLGALTTGALPFFADAVAYELEVTPQNARARALYERMGFQPKKNATLRRLRQPGSDQAAAR